MYPAEFLALLHKFKHPRFDTVGVERNRWGDRVREAVGLTAHGTIYFTTPSSKSWATDQKDEGKDMHILVPANCIPYDTRRDAHFNQTRGKFEGDLARGWRRTFAMLAEQGFLYPNEELSYLIGEDTWKLIPRRFWE